MCVFAAGCLLLLRAQFYPFTFWDNFFSIVSGWSKNTIFVDIFFVGFAFVLSVLFHLLSVTVRMMLGSEL